MVMKNPPRANFLRISGEDKAGFSGERFKPTFHTDPWVSMEIDRAVMRERSMAVRIVVSGPEFHRAADWIELSLGWGPWSPIALH